MTLRETYIEALLALFTATIGFPATPERSIVNAIARADGSTIVIHRGGEDPDYSKLGVVDRSCEILVTVITRDDTPDKIADDVMAVAHPLIMTFTAAKIIDVQEGVTDKPLFSNTDSKACMMTTHYFIRYRTTPNSLST